MEKKVGTLRSDLTGISANQRPAVSSLGFISTPWAVQTAPTTQHFCRATGISPSSLTAKAIDPLRNG